MYPQLHSLYAGLIVVAVMLFSRLPAAFGIVIIPICLLVESGQFIDQLRREPKRDAWLYAFTSFIQSIAIAYLFVHLRLHVLK